MGTQIPLYQLADVQIKDGPNQIQREDAKRRIIVGFNVRGRDVQSIVNELQGKVNTKLKFSAGYYITFGGAFENMNAAKKRLLIAVPVSLLLIFIFLYFAFKSIRQGLLIYSAIPLSAIGGIFLLAARGLPFSISAGVGFIALFGVAVLNGIVLIAEFNRLKMEGLTDVKRIVLMGTKVRLRPVLMTAFVASLGFLPMALSNGAGAEVQRPLATVVIGGLLLATFLTLFVLPVLYMIFETGLRKKNKAPKMHTPTLLLLTILFFSIPHHTNAQTPISLKAAIDTAIKNNAEVKNEQVKARYQQLLIRSAATIPQATLFGEVGQINSSYTDTKFGLTQSFSFPTVYAKQKELQTLEWQSSLLDVSVKERMLKKQVAEVFYNMQYIEQKKLLLQFSDSLYTDLSQKVNLRLATGETHILEKLSTENQLDQINLQRSQLREDSSILQLQFQLLLNSTRLFTFDQKEIKATLLSPPDSVLLEAHPLMQLAAQQKQLADARVALEKSKLLPDLSIGLNNTSIQGTGADNKNYTASHRFSTVQLGIGIPIFTKAQKSKISSAKLGKQIAENNFYTELQSLESHYQSLLVQYQKSLQAVAYFETKALKNADLLTTTANLQLNAGNINYLEWVQVVNPAISIKNDYIEAVKMLNNITIQLNYLLQK